MRDMEDDSDLGDFVMLFLVLDDLSQTFSLPFLVLCQFSITFFFVIHKNSL